MDHLKVLDENIISDIILCEPITSKGREALVNLELSTEEINRGFFFKKLYVESKYGKDKKYKEHKKDKDDNLMYYQYTVDSIQFEESKRRLIEFNARFVSDSPNQYPLLMLGVAGNGKSIEISERIYERNPSEENSKLSTIYIDLESAFTKIIYGTSFECPDQRDALWLFCIKLFDGIMLRVRDSKMIASKIWNNFHEIIVSRNLADEKQIDLFNILKDYSFKYNDKERELFELLKNLLQEPVSSIKLLLDTLMLIMYCTAPEQKQYIVFDNIEEYIKLDPHKVQIPNSAITTIYRCINEVVINRVNNFDRIEKDLGWKAFKIVIVLRRTSLGLLDSSLLQSPVRERKNTEDVTGYYQISEIWTKKRKYIWEEKLKEKFTDARNEKIISLVDILMKDGPQAIGTDYQSIIAPLMSYGIRRNARAQAHAACELYKIIYGNDQNTINPVEFDKLMKSADNKNPVHYMFRRALVEIQFKWTIVNDNQKRWRDLNIGYLKMDNTTHDEGKIVSHQVGYQSHGYITLMWRILAYLSRFPEYNTGETNKSVLDMFETVSLFKLVKNVLYCPFRKNKISEESYLQFARVLIALSDMSNDDTRSAPYVILGIKDDKFHESTDASTFAHILKRIYESGDERSRPEEIYNFRDYGARITDAGYSFLLDWQASFSFMAALHCYTVPALFFLKNVSSIKYVIKTVYEESLKLCFVYEDEAKSFCRNSKNFSLIKGSYLPIHNGISFTFKQRMKELHMNHLNLYRNFLENNYRVLKIPDNILNNLLNYINQYIEKYSGWITGKGAPECF